MTEFIAEIRMVGRDEEGGRQSPIASGYRPPLDFGITGQSGEKVYNDAALFPENQDQIFPGQRGTVRVKVLHPELLRDRLHPGVTFDVTEGPRRIVGHGTIIQVIEH